MLLRIHCVHIQRGCCVGAIWTAYLSKVRHDHLPIAVNRHEANLVVLVQFVAMWCVKDYLQE